MDGELPTWPPIRCSDLRSSNWVFSLSLGKKVSLSSSWEDSLVAQMVKNLPTMLETQVQSLGQEDPLEKGKATHSNTLVWEISWTEEPGWPQSMGSQRVRQTWVPNTWDFPGGASGNEPTCQCRRQKLPRFGPGGGKIPWRRKWQPTPVFLPGESHGQRSQRTEHFWSYLAHMQSSQTP